MTENQHPLDTLKHIQEYLLQRVHIISAGNLTLNFRILKVAEEQVVAALKFQNLPLSKEAKEVQKINALIASGQNPFSLIKGSGGSAHLNSSQEPLEVPVEKDWKEASAEYWTKERPRRRIPIKQANGEFPNSYFEKVLGIPSIAVKSQNLEVLTCSWCSAQLSRSQATIGMDEDLHHVVGCSKHARLVTTVRFPSQV